MKLLITIIFLIYGCKRTYEPAPVYIYDSYKLMIDHYTTDTSVRLKSFVFWKHDSVWKEETKRMLDTIPDDWWLMCPTYEMPEGWIEHRYYLKNGNKIQKSVYPKN